MRPPLEISRRPYGWLGTFTAMASPCEVHVADTSRALAEEVIRAVEAETRRIEGKFSRYLKGNIVDRINCSRGDPVRVDEETARLLDYAQTLHDLSDGRFDITSGVLREAWSFDGGSALPTRGHVRRLLKTVGWKKAAWHAPELTLPDGMQIDFGGIGKEYAVDRTAMMAAERTGNYLINFGGDLRAAGSGGSGKGWVVGIEAVDERDRAGSAIYLKQGAIATSGDAYRYIVRDGRRYGHILDPRTGWPVRDAPRSVTVCASTCTDAGMLATFAMLHGPDAEAFLESQNAQFWCLR